MRYLEHIRRVWDKAHQIRRAVRSSTFNGPSRRNWQLWMFYYRYLTHILALGLEGTLSTTW